MQLFVFYFTKHHFNDSLGLFLLTSFHNLEFCVAPKDQEDGGERKGEKGGEREIEKIHYSGNI